MSVSDGRRERVPLLEIPPSSTVDTPDCNGKVHPTESNLQDACEESDSLCDTHVTVALPNQDKDARKNTVLAAAGIQPNNEEILPSVPIEQQDSIRDDLSVDVEPPVVNSGAGPSRAAQPVVDAQEAEMMLVEPQSECDSDEEVQRKVILDLSPLKWQDGLLVAAVKSGSIENVRKNLQKGASARSVDHLTNLSCAQLATSAGHVDILNELLHNCNLVGHNADAFEVDSQQKTLLHLAVAGKHYECLQLLVQKGRVSRVDSNGESPLFAAVKLSWADGVRLLLGAGADVKAKYGRSPEKTVLYLAVLQKNGEVFSAIVTEVTRLNDCETIINAKIENETALFKATKLQWLKGVRLLLGAGADVKEKNGSKQKTVLQLAVTLPSVEISKEIVRRVSRLRGDICKEVVNATVDGQTPVIAAVRMGNLDLVNALLEVGANVMVRDKNEWNLLHSAAFYGHVQVIENLFKSKAEEMKQLQEQTSKGRIQGTPLHFAVSQGHVKCVDILIKKWPKETDFGFSETDKSAEKKLNLLHLASLSGKKEVMDYFIARLYNATHDMHEQIAPLLFQTTGSKRTPLHFALEKCQTEFVTALILSGSDLTAKCDFAKSDPRTAIDILIHRVPGSVQLLTDVMDRSIKKPRTEEYVDVHFKVLNPHKNINDDPDHGFGVLNALSETGDLLGQRKVLEHPLVASYLEEHWQLLRGPYMTFVVLSYIFTISITVFGLTRHWPMAGNNTTSAQETLITWNQTPLWLLLIFWISVAIFVLCPMVLLIIHELQCIGNFQRGTDRFESCIKLICFALTIAICVPDSPPEVAAFAILIANFELIVITSRIPGKGLYMLMFIEVTTRYAMLLSAFILVIFGFAVAFILIFRFSGPFDTFPWAMMKTIVMMTNEFEFENLKNAPMTFTPSFSLFSQLSAMAIFVLFIILVSFVLTNLLVAVAVLKVNKLHRISKQVMFLSNYRRLFLHPPKRWRFQVGIMQQLYKLQQALNRYLCPTSKDSPDDGSQDGLVMCRRIEMNQKGGFSYKHKLNSELVMKGIMDRERLKRMYAKPKGNVENSDKSHNHRKFEN